jgi:hypothetical protein
MRKPLMIRPVHLGPMGVRINSHPICQDPMGLIINPIPSHGSLGRSYGSHQIPIYFINCCTFLFLESVGVYKIMHIFFVIFTVLNIPIFILFYSKFVICSLIFSLCRSSLILFCPRPIRIRSILLLFLF